MISVHRRLQKHARKLVERQRTAGRMLTVFPDDTFLVSYPKSGNTWMRFLLTNLVSSDRPMTLLDMETRVPKIYDAKNAVLLRAPRPRVIASHEGFDPRYRRVIYIVRDPRDVAVSAYRHHRKYREIPDDLPIDLFIPRWLTETQFDSPRFGT